MTTATSDPVSKRARKLWNRLREWYGDRLTQAYGLDPPGEWCRIIDRENNAAISKALETVRRKHVSHPPTLLEFEEAFRRQRRTLATGEPTIPERMTTWIVKNRGLTQQQLTARWTWLHEGDAGTGHGFAFTGVSIPATTDGGRAMLIRVGDCA